jgi:competence protein ComEC
MIKKYFPILLTIVLYLLILWIRAGQGGWDLHLDLFKDFRTGLDKQIALYLPSPQAELLSGILLGENKNLPVGLHLGLRDTSTLHIVVASGQNLSMVAAFFFLLSGLIKRKLAVALSLAAILGYTFLTGFQVPILRAAIMVGLGFWAQLLGRDRETVWILIVTTGLMLLINPSWITSISFQLSVLATFGVVVVSPILLKKLKFLPELVSQDLAVSFAAQLMVFPVIAQNFHQLSLVALPTNILVLWTVAPVMILGAFMLVFSFILPPLAWILSLALNALLTYFVYIINFFGGLPFAWTYIGEYSIILWIGYYILILATLMTLNKKRPAPSED